MKKGIIFDFDGTIADSIHDIRRITNMTLSEMGYKKISLENTLKYIGDGSIHLLRRALRESDERNEEIVEKVLKRYLINYREHQGEALKNFDGVEETLKELVKRGVRLAVLSNKPHYNVKQAVKTVYGDRVHFEVIQGQEDRFPIKPNPASLNYVIEQMGLSKEDVAYIGDSEADAIVAQNAGVTGYSVLWGYRTKDILLGVGATNFLLEPKDLLKI